MKYATDYATPEAAARKLAAIAAPVEAVQEGRVHCEPCSDLRRWRQRAHILRLTFARPDGGITEGAARGLL